MKKLVVYGALPLLAGFIHLTAVWASPIIPGRVSLSVTDSVGIEKKDGKRYILHRVDEGQTLYALARRYGRSVADIKAANPDLNDALRYNQIVRIPIPDGALSKKEEKKIDKAIRKQEKEGKSQNTAETDAQKTTDPAKAGIHVVEPGQTLYSLAGRYGVSQADLRKWNNLSGNNVIIGQALIVSEKAYQDRNPSSPADIPPSARPAATPAHPAENRPNETKSVPPAEAKPTRRNEQTPASGTDEPVVKTAPSPPVAPATTPTSTPASKPADRPADKTNDKNADKNTDKPAEIEVVVLPSPGNDAPMPTRGRRISSSGVAEMIEGSTSGKYLALHRSAPVGTLVQVRNEFNNQSMWVKVIGRLPDTGVNDKILIKLSNLAFTKLSPEDRRFRAEVSYIVR